MNLFTRIKRKINVRLVRDSGSIRLTLALSGKPFAKKIGTSNNLKTEFSELNGIKLNIGGGKGHPKLEGWSIVDLRDTADIRMNITKDPLPFDDNSVDVIFCSHTLEHIFPVQLDYVLGQFYRVLKPGKSILRILVPDIALAIEAYSEKNEQFFYDGEVGLVEKNVPITGLLASWLYSSRIFKDPEGKGGQGHVHCFDYDYMHFRLTRIGFETVWQSQFSGSVLPELRSQDFDRHPHDSLCVEAMK
ncbi:methyltransferase domain-containing protein [Candidatus Marinimicrobia bacterium MT.SAG.3]|nr:methyltransferase domain-containing protein [Candidatus Marinimicrobia bacterium MT.SAG.3]